VRNFVYSITHRGYWACIIMYITRSFLRRDWVYYPVPTRKRFQNTQNSPRRSAVLQSEQSWFVIVDPTPHPDLTMSEATPKCSRDLSNHPAHAQPISPMSIHHPPYTSPNFGERVAQGNLRREEEYKARAAREIAEFDKKFSEGR